MVPGMGRASRFLLVHNTYIISDLHIGLPHFQQKLFEEFLTSLPDSAHLVLNGDTVDNPSQRLSSKEQRILQLLVEHSKRIRVIWIEGNHDEGFRLSDPGDVEFTQYHIIPEPGVYISHGEHFDNVMPYNRWFIKFFRSLHRTRILLGARPVHVAEYAKKWRLLYDYLRNNVATNAFQHARENGWGYVICGHVHYPEIRQEGGITYCNTGTWTESPPYYAYISDTGIELRQYNGGIPAGC